MWQHALGWLFLLTFPLALRSEETAPCEGSSCQTGGTACTPANLTCSQPAPCSNSTSCPPAAEQRIAVEVDCKEGNASCVQLTSRQHQVSEAGTNSSSVKPISATAKFSPSPFLGMITDPYQPESLVVGEVFHENLHQQQPLPLQAYHQHHQQQRQNQLQQHQLPFSFPRTAVAGYAAQGGEPYIRGFQQRSPNTVEINLGGTGYGDTAPGGTGYGRPDIEIRPGSYGRPELEINYSPEGKPGEQKKEHYPKPYDPGSAGQFTGYPSAKGKKQYEGYENMKNLIKPSKSSGPYTFEDNFHEKPISEETGEPSPQHAAFPPASAGHLQPAGDGSKGGFYPSGPSSAVDGYKYSQPSSPLVGGDSYKHVEHPGGGSKWKGLLKFLTTVLPIGLLVAALTPNVLVVSPSQEPPSMSKTPTGTTPTGKRSLEAPLGPCGLRKLCEALAESPHDFQQFLSAARQGSTEELKEIIRKAEQKECSSIGCEQTQEIKPTRPTYR